jgi:hypothetical protein
MSKMLTNVMVKELVASRADKIQNKFEKLGWNERLEVDVEPGYGYDNREDGFTICIYDNVIHSLTTIHCDAESYRTHWGSSMPYTFQKVVKKTMTR